MNRTSIEWVKNPDGTQGYTINPVKGLCPMACSYCYARAMYKRFKCNSEIRLDANSFLPLLVTIKKKPSRIFVGSTMELFGDWVKPEWMKFIFERVRLLPEHTFIFLTKQPQNLPKWSPFPENCWVGVTVTNEGKIYPDMFEDACRALGEIKAFVKYISFEPLLSSIYKLDLLKIWGIDWLIIGAQTKPYKPPKIEWVQEIVEAADRAGIPVFLKDNLRPLLCDALAKHQIEREQFFVGTYDTGGAFLRQEFPK